MAQQNKELLLKKVKEKLAEQIDSIFVEPEAEYAVNIKNAIYNAAVQLAKEHDADVMKADLGTDYDKEREELDINVTMQLHKPIDFVEVTVSKDLLGMSDRQFEKFVSDLGKEIENLEYGTSD